MVGTPADSVTFSDSNNSMRLAPSSCAPGNTSFAPTSGALYGRPQAFTWNIGTTGRTTSRAESPRASGRHAPNAWSSVDRWLYSTPFGLPVVPDV